MSEQSVTLRVSPPARPVGTGGSWRQNKNSGKKKKSAFSTSACGCFLHGSGAPLGSLLEATFSYAELDFFLR